jgi:hypothetical protein
MNVEMGAEAALFPEKEYISGIFVAVWSISLDSTSIIQQLATQAISWETEESDKEARILLRFDAIHGCAVLSQETVKGWSSEKFYPFLAHLS